MSSQINLLDEIIVDNFAGGGGASTGIELATGRPVTIAINHDPAAILMHQTNHPYTEHLQASVWDVDPRAVCAGRPVGLAWFSPDCKHFSKAKGSALVDRNIRGLAWIVLRWAGTVRPRVIILENVEEFKTWGPVRKGKPVKSKSGDTFQKWLSQLEALGYKVEYRELVAADYGAPTTRKRFVLIARCDGRPIRWPERTHAPRDSEEVKSGKCKPWVSAAEIIDWSLPCPSIFAGKAEIKEQYGVNAVRPLADNTMRRIIRGVDKFTIRSGDPFIVPTGYGERKGQAPRVHDIREPVSTVVSTTKQNLCRPIVAPLTVTNTSNSGDPFIVEPQLMGKFERDGKVYHNPIIRRDEQGQPFLVDCNHSGDGHIADIKDPSGTITQKCTKGVCSSVLAPLTITNTCNSVGTSADAPVHTVTTAGNQLLVAPNLIQYHAEQGDYARAQGLAAPISTVDASNRYGLVTAQMTEYYGNGAPLDVKDPMHTATSHDREALTTAIMQPFHAGGYKGKGNSPEEPVNTVTSSGGQSLVCSHVAEFKGQDIGQRADKPLRTVTAQGGEFGVVSVRTVKYVPGADLGYWPQIRALLNKHCGYQLADDEVLLIWIRGAWYYIRDIGLRMLTPPELYRAMGFPEDYRIDRDYLGRDYPKTQQVARCGNAVCPPMARAVVAANMPEWCVIDISTMAQLMEVVAG